MTRASCLPHDYEGLGDTLSPTRNHEAPDVLLGSLVGSFRLTELLGRGGMGTVYLGEHVSIGSRVGVKVLHPELSADAALVARFHAEACAVNRIAHRGVVHVFDVGVTSTGQPYLVMELLQGRSLANYALPLPVDESVELLIQMCEALEAAHRSDVVHRDLKPDNVFMVDGDRGRPTVKLLDFGIAKVLAGTEGRTMAGMLLGTPEYMAPEQCAGGQVDGRCDIYSLGVVAYQLLAGRVPFQGTLPEVLYGHQAQTPPSLRAVAPQVSSELAGVVDRCLAKSPEARYPTAERLRCALLQAHTPNAGILQLTRAHEAQTSEPAPPQPPRPGRGVSAPEAPGVVRPPSEPPPSAKRFVLLRVGERDAPQRHPYSGLSRAGLFVETQAAPPPLLSQVWVAFESNRGQVGCRARVVRHVGASQAATWRMSPGFAVELDAPSTTFRQLVERLLPATGARPAGSRSPSSRPEQRVDDPRAESVILALRRRDEADPYAFLALSQEASFNTVRESARALRTELETVGRRRLSAKQAAQVEALETRLRWAEGIVGDLEKRAALDARRGNYRGIARCLAAGLTAQRLDVLRDQFARERPGSLGVAQKYELTAAAFLRQNEPEAARVELERALEADPLNLRLHQRFWAKRERGGVGPGRGSPPVRPLVEASRSPAL